MAVQVQFKKVQVAQLSKTPSKVLVRWEMYQTGAELADYQFVVERGEYSDNEPGFQSLDIYQKPLREKTEHTSTANMQAICKPIAGLDDLFYVDYSPDLNDLSKALQYRIKCTKISTQEELLSETVSFSGDLDLTGLYIADEVNFLLEDTIGVPSLVYNRRRSGVYCPDCFDPIQKKRTRSGCITCFDTNWVGGFYAPVDAFIDYSPNPKNSQIAMWGEVQTNESRVLMANFPNVNPGDLLRELRSNRLWRIVQIPITEKRRAQLLQMPIVSEIKPGDVEYKIPVDEQFLLAKLSELEAVKKKREF